jgi:hypothetical protein
MPRLRVIAAAPLGQDDLRTPTRFLATLDPPTGQPVTVRYSQDMRRLLLSLFGRSSRG